MFCQYLWVRQNFRTSKLPIMYTACSALCTDYTAKNPNKTKDKTKSKHIWNEKKKQSQHTVDVKPFAFESVSKAEKPSLSYSQNHSQFRFCCRETHTIIY